MPITKSKTEQEELLTVNLSKMNKQELLKCLKEALTHLSEVEKHTKFHNEIIKKLYLQVPPELSEDKEINSLLKELDNRNEEVAISWSMYLFKG